MGYDLIKNKMKILAVIPARAGSKGIPNKNIRLIHNKPLIYYAIQNALNSRYITDVVVSTDSPEVEIIASQMNVNVKKRNIALCGDSITLDSVVNDVASGYDCDYVVTMQPTSPTLTATTLDNAIEYTIKNELDTLISVVNHPHLSWGDEQGKRIPNYSKRLNRQYLPPYYLETGAFLISKAEVVTSHSRIGKKVDVYVIPEEEAIDIDTFSDLMVADVLLQKKKVAIYVNGNNKRGLGHIYRALEIADEFYTKPDIYYDINQTNVKMFGFTTHNLIGVNGFGELLSKLQEKEYNLLINDVRTTSIDYMIAIKKTLPNAKIVNFEDDGEGIYKADLVFNALYQQSNLSNVKVGEKYYIVSKLFMFYHPIDIKENVRTIFISFGGADPQNYSDRMLNIISNKKKYEKLHFIVVLGRAKNNVEALMNYNKYDNIDVLFDVKNMPDLMSKCDIGITSRGRTGYELAVLGIPTIAMAQNEREEKHGFVNNDNGFTYLGLNPSDYIIESTLDMYINLSVQDRMKYQYKLLSHDLRNGRRHVMGLINDL
ncbi:cytidyltransferase [Bacteroides fragilis]|uniref:cytidylyltransferase domain-containing protein n=6 Tax=Bacteroides fragilis TaxID=817 RepID=UPI0022AA6BEA|nr:cytidyltransferase [Bacteroides fragilis]MCZ2649860.1 cytidyltransferase [Bacteroides fragilis]